MLNRTSAAVAAACLGLAAAAAAAPAATLALTDALGDPHAVSVPAGQPFTVTLRLDADQAFAGYSIYLSDPDYAGVPRFTLTGRTSLAGNPFTDDNAGDPTLVNHPIDDLTADLGYTAGAGQEAAAGVYDLMSLTVMPSAALAPGAYVIGLNPNSGLTTPILTDVSFAGLTSYNVTVTPVPEPSTSAITAGLGLYAARARRRRR